METTLTYEIKYEGVREKIDDEVSKTARRITGEGGELLYDLYKLYMNDEPQVFKSVNDSVNFIATRYRDVCLVTDLERNDKVIGWELQFNLPDFITELYDEVGREIVRYASCHSVADWFSTRQETFSSFFARGADDALLRLTIMLRTRKQPERERI